MKKKILSILAIILAIAVLLGVYYAFREQPHNSNIGTPGDGATQFAAKVVTLEVTDHEGKTVEYSLSTHSDYLENVMNEADGLSYEARDGMVITVNGTRADYVLDGAYWAFYVNGEYCNYGIATQPVNDGDAFSIVYTKA